jgi:hypothetical protein
MEVGELEISKRDRVVGIDRDGRCRLELHVTARPQTYGTR